MSNLKTRLKKLSSNIVCNGFTINSIEKEPQFNISGYNGNIEKAKQDESVAKSIISYIFSIKNDEELINKLLKYWNYKDEDELFSNLENYNYDSEKDLYGDIGFLIKLQ
jgi:hypothetical protein